MHHGRKAKGEVDSVARQEKGKSTLSAASPGIRGRETHSLSSSGRKTARRTQGGATNGAGRGFKL